MQCTGEKKPDRLKKRKVVLGKLLQIFFFFFFERIEAGGQGEWSQYNITRSLKQVHQNVISSSMEERCHGVREVLM